MCEKYDSYDIRHGFQKLETELEKSFMDILMTFGKSIDNYYDDGDYDTAMDMLMKAFERKEGRDK